MSSIVVSQKSKFARAVPKAAPKKIKKGAIAKMPPATEAETGRSGRLNRQLTSPSTRGGSGNSGSSQSGGSSSTGGKQDPINVLRGKLQKKDSFLAEEEWRKVSAQEDLQAYVVMIVQMQKELEAERKLGRVLEDQISKHKELPGDLQHDGCEPPAQREEEQRNRRTSQLEDFGELEQLQELMQQVQRSNRFNQNLSMKVKAEEVLTMNLERQVAGLTKQARLLQEMIDRKLRERAAVAKKISRRNKLQTKPPPAPSGSSHASDSTEKCVWTPSERAHLPQETADRSLKESIMAATKISSKLQVEEQQQKKLPAPSSTSSSDSDSKRCCSSPSLQSEHHGASSDSSNTDDLEKKSASSQGEMDRDPAPDSSRKKTSGGKAKRKNKVD